MSDTKTLEMSDTQTLEKPMLKYEPIITLENLVSAASGLITIGVLWGVQTSENKNFQKGIDFGAVVNKEQDAQISAIKENAATQKENTSLIKQDLSYVREIVLEIRSEQKEVKRELQK
jgi:hypothetical protein